MLKDKRACGFEEVSKPSIGIYTKEEETVKKKKKTGGCVARRAKSRHSRHIQDKGPNMVRTFSILIIKINTSHVVIFKEQIYKTSKKQSKP
jgi:hypothetical protein